MTIPDSVTSIGGNLFNGCTSLASVTIGNGVTSIETGMFQDCKSLKSVIVPDSVTSIGGNAFYGCVKLKTVTIPASVTSIESRAFKDCGLETIQYGGTKEEWEKIEGLEDSGLLDEKTTITYQGIN